MLLVLCDDEGSHQEKRQDNKDKKDINFLIAVTVYVATQQSSTTVLYLPNVLSVLRSLVLELWLVHVIMRAMVQEKVANMDVLMMMK